MNKFFLMGNLAKDPELKSKGDLKFCVLTVVSEIGYGENKKTHFIEATAFGNIAETIAKYFSKGRKILLEGVITTVKKENEYPRLSLVVNGFEFVESKKAETTQSESQTDVEDEDLPF